MGPNENLKKIISQQKETLSQLEAEYQIIETSDITRENTELKAEIEKLRLNYEKTRNNLKSLSDENAGLKNALYEQIYNEKIKIVNTTAQKLDVLFKSSVDGELNSLSLLENSVKDRINDITATLRRHKVDAKDEIYQRLGELSTLLDEKVTYIRLKAASTPTAFSEAEKTELEALKKEQITDEQVHAIAKKNNFERFVGLNLLNGIGILLIIIGVITAARFTYVRLPDIMKGIMMFVFGAAMLIAGELMNRKKPNIFSLGVTSGGIGVLYVALATSYFSLKILDMYPALAVCVLITGVAFVLSNRYNSHAIIVFALVGGYLPMFSIGSNITVVYGAMVYFVLLNLLALLVSFSKKWRLASFVGLSLNIIGTVYICLSYSNSPTIIEKIVLILYVMFAFLNYTLIPIVSTYRTKAVFRKSDIVLLAINTFFSSLIMYFVFYQFHFNDFTGMLAIIFAVIYLLLGRIIEKKFPSGERNAKALFYLTGLMFVILIIPFQFGRAWLSLGWLAEGVLLATYGILYNEKAFKRSGFVICGLCLSAFLLIDCAWTGDYLFPYKYLAITIGSVIIMGAYMYKKMMAGLFPKIYKYFVIANIWFYTLYIIEKLKAILSSIYPNPATYRIDYLISAFAIVATFLIAYIVPRIKILSDLGIKILSIVLYFIGIVWLFIINSVYSPTNLQLSTANIGITIIGTIILLVIGLLSVLAVRDLMQLIVMERKIGVEWYPLIISGYYVLILTQNLITQYNLQFSNAAISIIYVLTALAWIIFGFMRRYSFIRRFGLGLAILAVIKLFIVDLSNLTQGYQIVTYFALGVTLVAISFVYQYFSKRLELKAEVTVDDEENH